MAQLVEEMERELTELRSSAEVEKERRVAAEQEVVVCIVLYCSFTTILQHEWANWARLHKIMNMCYNI